MAAMSAVPLARTPTPYPKDEPSLWERLLGKKQPVRKRFPAPVSSSTRRLDAGESSGNGYETGGNDEDALAEERARAIQFPVQKSDTNHAKLSRSPTPYPDQPQKRKASILSLLSAQFVSSPLSSPSSSAGSLNRTNTNSGKPQALARSPTPYPQDKRARKWWQWGQQKQPKRRKSGTTTSQIVIVRKEPLHPAMNRSTSGGVNSSTVVNTLTTNQTSNEQVHQQPSNNHSNELRPTEVTIVDLRDKSRVDKGKGKEYRTTTIRIMDDAKDSGVHVRDHERVTVLNNEVNSTQSKNMHSRTNSVRSEGIFIEERYDGDHHGGSSSSVTSINGASLKEVNGAVESVSNATNTIMSTTTTITSSTSTPDSKMYEADDAPNLQQLTISGN